MKLIGKVALITGASKGIGKSIAVEFAKEGALVIVNYCKDKEAADDTVNIIRQNGGYAIAVKCDVSVLSDVNAMVEEVVPRFGEINILVNNAGISHIGLFMDMNETDFDKIFDINLKGVFNCSKAVLKNMLDKKSGSIINISSMWGNVGASCEVVYSASKGAVNAFTKALGKELAPSNIRVNAIAPGVIDTQMNKCFSDDDLENIKQEIPMMRLGTGEEVAKLAVFLASDESNYITSQIINIDGGMC
ncbi:MAG: SDR family oxidoreductase [Bacillota bacterium]|nr:SDR family oxidoreductase [Bacillota bacterium]